MLQLPTCTITPTIEEKINRVFVLCETLKFIPIPKETAIQVFHRQYLKSSLFSARIEGNLLTLEQINAVNMHNPKQIEKKEIANLMHALQLLPRWTEKITVHSIQEMHAQVVKGLRSDSGKLRREQTAIFDAMGNAVYLTPDKETMEAMLKAFFEKWNAPATAKQALADCAGYHLFFEKIHPFVDGNGRVGRILLHILLAKHGISPKEVVIPIEEYIDTHKDTYYFYLEQGMKTIHDFSEFLLDAITWGLEKILQDIKEHPIVPIAPVTSTAILLPRRQELIQILTDHPFSSMDFISRRFPTIPRRTLAYDLSWLIRHAYIHKHGTTKGVSYSVATG